MNGRCDRFMRPEGEHLQFEFYPGESACQSGQVGERWNGKDFRLLARGGRLTGVASEVSCFKMSPNGAAGTDQ